MTSAMKLVASSRLHKAQQEIGNIRPYEQTLDEILAEVAMKASSACSMEAKNPAAPVALVAMSSNNSLCGAFNINVVKQVTEYIHGLDGRRVRLFSAGKKMSEALRRMEMEPDYNDVDLISHPKFEKSSAFAEKLIAGFARGEYSEVVLVYNKFVSTSTQKPVVERYLPYCAEDQDDSEALWNAERDIKEHKYIYEPDADTIAKALLPLFLHLKFHAAVLDSVAAEHAARTVAMQTATDNAERLLADLTLEYNKGRQQKITAEILDLVGGSAR